MTMRISCIIGIFCVIISCAGQTYTIYFSITNVAQTLIDPYVQQINNALPGVDLKIDIVKKRSFFGGLFYGEESTRPTSLARLALMYFVGGTTFSYLTILYLIYRVYQVVSIIRSLLKEGLHNNHYLTQQEIVVLELYSAVNEWLKRHHMRWMFPFNKEYEEFIATLPVNNDPFYYFTLPNKCN